MSKSKEQINENAAEALLKMQERKAEEYYKKYKSHMQVLEKSLLAKTRSITPADYHALGHQLDEFANYKRFLESAGNVNSLGKLPLVAFDVITAVYATSIVPAIASVQPIDEVNGNVYFKNILAAEARGNMTAGQAFTDPRTGSRSGKGYSSSKTAAIDAITTTAGDVDYTVVLPAKPIVSESLKLTVSNDTTTYGEDVGVRGSDRNVGTILGNKISGTINYLTGELIVKFAADPGAGAIVRVQYQINYELAADLPKVTMFMDSKPVRAYLYTLKQTVGLVQSYTMSKRFGSSYEDDMAEDLVTEMNKELASDLVFTLRQNAQGTPVTFSRTPDAGVAEYNHRQAYKYKLAECDANFIAATGRGTVKVVVAGRNHCAFVEGLPGFKKLADGNAIGAHIFGMLDDKLYVRVPESDVMPVDSAIALHKGNQFEAAASWSPFMPLTVTDALPEGFNPLNTQKAAAMIGAIESMIPGFATELNLTA
jgi:hypothetical protein